ncbi:hypothetical protein KJ870_04100 [bacterium]|nr:hypothetical protein [bacterium]MBU1434101.1 hypothetical protein [bacterium]MBU1503082.1 hypothetical protein [bacterium]
MKHIILLLLTSFIFMGCSFTQKPNKWEYESAAAFESYKKNFLSQRDTLAKNDFNRAVEHAKSGSDFNLLATIYLGECALNISVGIQNKCENYLAIKDLTTDLSLEPYYNFIAATLEKEQIPLLPAIYQNYVWHVRYQEYSKAQQDIATMTKMSSKFLAAALMKENLDNKMRERMIELGSYYGYKRVVLFWLEESKKWTKNKKELELLDKKISILNQTN